MPQSLKKNLVELFLPKFYKIFKKKCIIENFNFSIGGDGATLLSNI